MEVKGKERVVATGNLVAALFEHDTSRAQDPQAHLHAVIANVTQGPDGKWRALHNEKLWSLNTLLNSIAMAGFRERVEALGYEIGDRTKHGNFEAAGIGSQPASWRSAPGASRSSPRSPRWAAARRRRSPRRR